MDVKLPQAFLQRVVEKLNCVVILLNYVVN